MPAAGRAVVIQRNGNVAVDCTDEVHPEVAHIAALAARVVGLDIAGIDMVAQDISRPLHAQGGAIVEVNAGPGLLMHLKPAVGSPRPVGRAICRPPVSRRRRQTRATPAAFPWSAWPARATPSTWRAWWPGCCTWAGATRAWPAATACSWNDAASTRATAPTGKPAHRLLMNRAVQAVVIENDAAHHPARRPGL